MNVVWDYQVPGYDPADYQFIIVFGAQFRSEVRNKEGVGKKSSACSGLLGEPARWLPRYRSMQLWQERVDLWQVQLQWTIAKLPARSKCWL